MQTLRNLALLLGLLLAPVPALAAGSFVQGKCDDPATPSNANITFTSNVTAGDTIVVFIRYSSTTDNFTSVSDNLNAGNYTKVIDNTESFGAYTLYALYEPNSAGGSMTVNEKFSVSATVRWCIEEWSGIIASSPLDTSAYLDDSSLLSTQTGASVTTANPNDVLITIAATSNSQNETITDGAPYALALNGNTSGGNLILHTGFQNVSSTGTYSETYTLSHTDALGTAQLAFKTSVSSSCPLTRRTMGVGC